MNRKALISFLPLCEQRGVAIILGGGFNSGILATGAVSGARYNYRPAPEPVMENVRRIEAVCREFAVNMAAAALQFVLAHPAIATIIPGTEKLDHLERNLTLIGESGGIERSGDDT